MTNLIATSSLLTDLAARIRAEQENARLAFRTGIEHALRVGELLLDAKQMVDHGHWSYWLHAHCDLSERTAQGYMRLARNRSNPQLTADLTISDALKQLAKPEPFHIDDASAVIDMAASCLPTDGEARIGVLETPGFTEMFGVIEDEHHPGFYRLAHIEIYVDADGEDTGGCFTEPQRGRPVRGDFVRSFLEHHTRHPDAFDKIEWRDHPADFWPFPRSVPRLRQ